MHISQLKCPEKQNINDQNFLFEQRSNGSIQKDYQATIQSPFKIQYNKCKDILHLSQKRLIQSLKKLPMRKGSLFENTKMKRLQLNFHSISSSKDNKKDLSDNVKMPDLLKIKLKKQLETIQKSVNHKKSVQKSKKFQKSYCKVNKLSNILFDSQSYGSNQNSKRYEIIKANLKNAKKTQGFTNRKKSQNNAYKIKNEEKQINLNQKRKVTKYFHLLDYANKQIKLKSPEKNDIHYVNRVKTESIANSRLFNKGIDSLELSGFQISEESPLNDHKLKLVTLFQQTINAKQIQDAYFSRKRKQSHQKIIKNKTRLVKSEGKKQKSVKNHEISPWISQLQQIEIGNNLMFNSDYE